MHLDLHGETALVTGASSGLGAHFARVLANCGAKVALAARRKDKLEAEADEIRRAGGSAVALELDVRDVDQLGAVVSRAGREMDGLSILVNNAGLNIASRAVDVSVSDYDHVMDVNLKAPFLLSTLCARRWIEGQTPGRIVNIASLAAFKPLPLLIPYAMSKAALVHMTRCLAREWARFDINVNAIAPGYVQTEINAGFWETPDGQKIIKRLPRRRVGVPSDLDGVFLALCDPKQRFVTGECITVDDGQGLA